MSGGPDIAGKAPSDELGDASEMGFDSVELLLWPEDVESEEAAEQVLSEVEQSDTGIATVHTPHTPYDRPEYLENSARIASEYDVPLVVHSQRTQLAHIRHFEDYFDEFGFEFDYAYENNPETGTSFIEKILDSGQPMVLDTAHLGCAEKDALTDFKELLDDYSELIEAVHINDAKTDLPVEDGKAFGDGDMNMKGFSYAVLDSGYEGPVVIEVPPESQEADREYFESCLETYENWQNEMNDYARPTSEQAAVADD